MRLEQWGAGKEQYRMASECPKYVLGRVVLQERDLYQVVTEQEDYSARVSGKFRYEAESPSDYPAVGDFVLLQCVNKNDIAVIQKYTLNHKYLDKYPAAPRGRVIFHWLSLVF